MEVRKRPSRPVKLADDLAVLSPQYLHIDEPDLPYVLDVELVVEEQRAVCEAILVSRRPGGSPISGEGLRRIPLRRILHEATELGTAWAMERGAAAPGTIKLVPAGPASRRRAEATLRSRRSSRSVTPDDLRTVARAVRTAQGHGRSTMREVAEALGVQPGYARRLIQRARDENDPETNRPYLERTGPRRGGRR
jgi:hypothetical protein